MESVASLDSDLPENVMNPSDIEETNASIKTDTSSAPNSNSDEPRAIVQRETTALFVIRAFLVIFLIGTALALSLGMYHLVQAMEYNAYIGEFNDLAGTVVRSFHDATLRKIWVGNMMSTSLTSFFERSKMSYPNLTHPDFPILAMGPRNMTDAAAITFSPLLDSPSALAMWEAFAALEITNTGTGTGTGTGIDRSISVHSSTNQSYTRRVQDGIFSYDNDGRPVDFEGPGPYAPIWHVSASGNISGGYLMYNQMADEARRSAINRLIEDHELSFSRTQYGAKDANQLSFLPDDTPRSTLYYPVADSFETKQLVGVIGIEFEWIKFFDNAFTKKSSCLQIVLESSLGQLFTFQMTPKGKIFFLGEGDLHDGGDEYIVESTFHDLHELVLMGYSYVIPVDHTDLTSNNNTYLYRLKVFPSDNFASRRLTQMPMYYALGVAAIFILNSAIFILYDRLVERRQNLTMKTAERSTNVLNSLYPANVRMRLFQDESDLHRRQRRPENTNNNRNVQPPTLFRRVLLPLSARSRLKSYLHTCADAAAEVDNKGGDHDKDFPPSPPIADLFPSTTVMFADIAGFTAWSSEREPAQVFKLLETLYRKFDRLARKHGVFKVETIGDCYMAVTGLPEPNDDHAMIMCRFAQDIKSTMQDACQNLEAILGPGTADLCLRIGIHSGAVTAGVLRGDKSRFQLFGDTVNTASRIESNSLPNRIQISQSTADMLTLSKKSHWFTARSTKVEAKGKGSLQTYWLRPKVSRDASAPAQSVTPSNPSLLWSETVITACDNSVVSTFSRSLSSSSDDDTPGHQPKKQASSRTFYRGEDGINRLIDWNVDVLASGLQKLTAMRLSQQHCRRLRRKSMASGEILECPPDSGIPIDELTDIIELPAFSENVNYCRKSTELVALDDEVRKQLRDFVCRIAAMYKTNPFHNLEHASHVTMSASKLMNRIVSTPDGVSKTMNQTDADRRSTMKQLKSIHDSTFGISSDPLAQFAIVFSALIHDVDHTGKANGQLVKESAEVALMYRGLSVAEQNSVEVAWSILVEPQFEKLRNTIFPTPSDRKRFRQLVVAIVLATDIIDVELQQLRKNRWEKAFHDDNAQVDMEEDMNRKATIVIEHIIQASDVAHTMQHWHVYCKWNEKLYEERYLAYLGGHEGEEPSERWFDDEIGFLDRYVIPLAKKLKECGVFGVSSDEYLGFAIENRMEWETKGRDIVATMAARARIKYGTR